MFQDRSNNPIRTVFAGEAVQVTLGAAVEVFLRAEMIGLSPETAIWYRRRLEALVFAFGPGRLLVDLMEADLVEYYARLHERDMLYEGSSHPDQAGSLSPYTLHGHLRAIKRLFKWLFRKGILPVDIAVDLTMPRLPRQGRKGISEANLAAILDAAREDPRDYALLRFLESTGVRRGGIEDLRLGDLNLDSGDERIRRRATVREKGEKERTVIMSRESLQSLQAWLAVRPDVTYDQVFLGHSPGQPWHGLSAEGISGIIARYVRRLGLQGACSPHQWRHRWARHRLHKGMELSQVSQLLGHSDVSVTVKFYGQFTVDQLQEAYDRYEDE